MMESLLAALERDVRCVWINKIMGLGAVVVQLQVLAQLLSNGTRLERSLHPGGAIAGTAPVTIATGTSEVLVCPAVTNAMKLDDDESTPPLKLLHFNNDLTNMLSCISPFHRTIHTPFGREMLSGAVNETRGLGISRHVLAPGLCSQPWYPSQLLPPANYKAWFNATFQSGTTGNGFMDFAAGGGDLLTDFAAIGAAAGEQPGISFRVQDIQALNRAPAHNYGNLDQFFYEHRHDPQVKFTECKCL